MGKGILTPKQLDFLELAQKQSSVTKRFYLTGGTALSEFYLKHRLLEVSSLYDIAVNKIHTVGMRARARDYVDLYFIFNKSEYKPQKYLERIRLDSQAKFDWPLEAKNLGAAFLRVKDLPQGEFPKMLVPFERKDMENFFLKLAKSLEKNIFKK